MTHHAPGWTSTTVSSRDASPNTATSPPSRTCTALWLQHTGRRGGGLARRRRRFGCVGQGRRRGRLEADPGRPGQERQSRCDRDVLGRSARAAGRGVGARFSAVADLWGGNVVMPADRLTRNQPVAVIDMTPQLNGAIDRAVRQRRYGAEPGPGEPARGSAQGEWQDLRLPPLRRRRTRVLLLPHAVIPSAGGHGWLGQSRRILFAEPGLSHVYADRDADADPSQPRTREVSRRWRR